MKSISVTEFKNLVERGDWTRKQDYGIADRTENRGWRNPESSNGEEECWVSVSGWAALTSTLDDVTITYQEGFVYDDETDPSSLTTDTDNVPFEIWEIDGVVVRDDDGDEIPTHELVDIASLTDSPFAGIRYRGVIDDAVCA